MVGDKLQKFTQMTRDDFLKQQQSTREMQIGINDNIIDSNISRKEIVNIYDKTFFNKTMIMFESNEDVNSMFINDIEDKTDTDWIMTFGAMHDVYNSCIRVIDSTFYSEIYSREIFTYNNTESRMNNFYLSIDSQIAHSDTLTCFIQTSDGREYPIVANGKDPLIIKSEMDRPFRVRVKLIVKRHESSRHIPYINGFALMYEDSYASSQLDIFNKDFQLNTDEEDDTLVLFRDNSREDVLYKVESFRERTELFYDDDGRLALIDVSDIESGGIKERIELVYEPYLSSTGSTDEVLTKVRTKRASREEME